MWVFINLLNTIILKGLYIILKGWQKNLFKQYFIKPLKMI